MKNLMFSLLIISLVLMPSIVFAQMDKSLILYLPFDEGSGRETKDSSQYGNNGAFKGEPQWVKGKFGFALRFDGKDDYIEVPDSPSLHVKDSITVEIWFYKVDEWENRYAKIVIKGDADRKVPISWWLSQGPKEYPFYFGVQTVAGKGTSIEEQGIWKEYPKLNEWHHVAGVYDGNNVKLYIDGALKVTGKPFGGDITMSQHTLRIGWGYATEYFNGIVDEVRVWSRVLSQDEIKTYMEKGLVVMPPQSKLTTTWGSLKVR